MMSFESFNQIFARAEENKGGYDALLTQLPVLLSDTELMHFSDALYLERLTNCIFVSGFSNKVIKNKWPGFLEVFHDFDLNKLNELADDEWDAMRQDTRIIRNARKIQSVRENLGMIRQVSAEHQGFGKFLVNWGAQDQIGLMKFLNKNGNQIGDNTAQYFLRYVGIDGFVLSSDVIAAAIESGVDITPREKGRGQKPISQKDKKVIQEAFNYWHNETKLPYTHLSKIMAFSQS